MGDDWAADPPEPEGWPLPRRARRRLADGFDDDLVEVADERAPYQRRWSEPPTDDYLPLADEEPDGTPADVDRSEAGAPDDVADRPDTVPWWVTQGEHISETTLSNHKRERGHRLHGFAIGYDTFWDHVDDDPVSVVPTLRAVELALDRRYVALRSLWTPRLPPLMLGVGVAAIAAFGIVNGPLAHRLVALATSLLFGVTFALVVSRLVIQCRVVAVGGGAVAAACVVVSTVPTIHGTRWYDVLVGLAFAGAGLLAVALWPIMRERRVERDHWTRPDVALIAALLDFAVWVEFNPATQDRRHAVQALDRAATTFEFAWHRVHRTGVDIADRQLRGWASRIRAETRELQRWYAIGVPSKLSLLLRTYLLIQAIVNRFPLDDHEDGWVRHGSWRRPPTSAIARLWVRGRQSGRYVRQCLLATVIASAALLLLAVTIWSAVPTFIGGHVSRDLGSALTFDPTMRVFVAGISLSLFALAGRAFTHRR
ncbi:hypothetical protein OOJ91_06170 [Micromonospora lupini]|uniref:hypothetical protein n=1 Tax=Micromonospora lupini TaxID=285679 RepID=UPI002254EAF8|nr:hypothetical protein [Micromonospora lupini]MCX5065462.1 hypothetical protein [Micromonospora lupini]